MRKRTTLNRKEILCIKTKDIRLPIRTSMLTVGLSLFRIRSSKNCMLVLMTNLSCAHSITLLSLVRKKFSRYLTNTITIATRFMLNQAQLGHKIKIALHCVKILLKSFLAHPDLTDNIQRMKQADHNIEIMSQ